MVGSYFLSRQAKCGQVMVGNYFLSRQAKCGQIKKLYQDRQKCEQMMVGNYFLPRKIEKWPSYGKNLFKIKTGRNGDKLC